MEVSAGSTVCLSSQGLLGSAFPVVVKDTGGNAVTSSIRKSGQTFIFELGKSFAPPSAGIWGYVLSLVINILPPHPPNKSQQFSCFTLESWLRDSDSKVATKARKRFCLQVIVLLVPTGTIQAKAGASEKNYVQSSPSLSFRA